MSTEQTPPSLSARLTLAAAQPARGGRPWPGKAELATVVDELRRELADLARSGNAAARADGADLAVAAIEGLTELTERARRAHRTRRGRRTPTEAEVTAKLAAVRAGRPRSRTELAAEVDARIAADPSVVDPDDDELESRAAASRARYEAHAAQLAALLPHTPDAAPAPSAAPPEGHQ